MGLQFAVGQLDQRRACDFLLLCNYQTDVCYEHSYIHLYEMQEKGDH